MNVIPPGFNFNFLLPGMRLYIVCMLVFGFAGGLIMKMISPKLVGIGTLASLFIGLYIGSLLNP